MSVIFSAIGVGKAAAGAGALARGGTRGFGEWLLSGSRGDAAALVFFAAFLALDCGIGLAEYPSELRWDSTWVHHVAYAAIALHLVARGWPNLLLVFMVCEVPTALLALGSVLPAARNDAAFGASFAATRLGYFAVLAALFVAATPVRPRRARARASAPCSRLTAAPHPPPPLPCPPRSQFLSTLQCSSCPSR